MLPFIEVRHANQEDHDDLADVFNNQSETVTEAYGEYFLAELIASQNENNKALVAQVKDKAVGLMGLTNEVDTTLLHQCFELDQYDNLLKPDFMDAVRKRREYIIWEKSIEEEKKRIEFLKQMKQETMRCNVVAQRIALQEFMADKQEQMTADLEAAADPETVKSLNREKVDKMLDEWLAEFNLVQPSQFFKDHPTNDSELVCSIQTEKEFMLTTLEFFGLPKGYMGGAGHFPDWGKDKKDDKSTALRKRNQQKKGAGGKAGKKLEALKKKRGLDKTDEENVRPTHFDISVFTKCFKRFIACTGEVRSATRRHLLKDMERTMKVFLDPFFEISYKKVVDVHELAALLVKEGLDLEPVIVENLGSILLCFGDIEYEHRYGDRVPPETEDEKRQRLVAELKLKEYEEAKKQAELEGAEFDETEYKRITIEEKKPVLMLLSLISVTDMKFCAQKMFEYDQILFQMGTQKFDTEGERAFMALRSKKSGKKFYDEEEDVQFEKEPSKVYSENPEIQEIVE